MSAYITQLKLVPGITKPKVMPGITKLNGQEVIHYDGWYYQTQFKNTNPVRKTSMDVYSLSLTHTHTPNLCEQTYIYTHKTHTQINTHQTCMNTYIYTHSGKHSHTHTHTPIYIHTDTHV